LGGHRLHIILPSFSNVTGAVQLSEVQKHGLESREQLLRMTIGVDVEASGRAFVQHQPRAVTGQTAFSKFTPHEEEVVVGGVYVCVCVWGGGGR